MTRREKIDKNDLDISHMVLGKVTPDPLAEMPDGSTVEVCPVRLHPSTGERSCSLRDWHMPEGILLSVHFREGDSVHVAGSGVIIAPGVAISAKHVLESRREGLRSGAVGVLCLGICSSGALLWRVRHVTEVPDSDLIILGIELASAPPRDNRFNFATISLRPPSIGENLCILGFRASRFSFEFGDGLPIHGQVIQAQGAVLQRFDAGRDSRLLPWPVVEVDCPAWGGMSGGPAFDEEGCLIGLITSSFQTDGEPSPTFVSQIWPALVTAFEACWPGGIYERAAPMIELDPRLCEINERNRITRDEVDGLVVWQYSTSR
jgi:hypothetical protein